MTVETKRAGETVTNAAIKKPKQVDERKQFIETFDVIAQELVDGLANYRLPENGVQWFKTMINTTIPGGIHHWLGKMNRGLTVASSLKSILKRSLTEKEMFDANLLGWCIEMLQAFFLIQDDIMDASITRRGEPCWYKRVAHFN